MPLIVAPDSINDEKEERVAPSAALLFELSTSLL